MGEQDKEETKFDIDYVFNPDKYNNLYPYGFVDSEKVEKVNYEFNNTNTSLQEIPEESKAAIKYLSEECSSAHAPFTLLMARAFAGFISRMLTPLKIREPTTNTPMNRPMWVENAGMSMQAQVR